MYDIFLFDLDNTIFNFDEAEEDSFRKVIASSPLTYDNSLLTSYQKINSALWSALENGKISKEEVLFSRFQKFFEIYHITVDGKKVEEEYRSYLDQSSSLMPEAKTVLQELKNRGKKIYSASNGVYKTQISRLKNANIYDFFDGHFISEQITYEKPSPQFFAYCFKTLGAVPKESILMVGDSPNADVNGAIGVGLDVCFYTQQKNVHASNATYTISKLSELFNLI